MSIGLHFEKLLRSKRSLVPIKNRRAESGNETSQSRPGKVLDQPLFKCIESDLLSAELKQTAIIIYYTSMTKLAEIMYIMLM